MKISIVAAMTADGYIGKDADHLATTWTNKEDKYLFRHFVQEAGNMIFGYNTFMTTARKYPSVFTKSMPDRRLLVYTHHPEAIAEYPKVEAVSEDPTALVARLEKEGVESIALCGGVQIYTMFMKAGLVDDIYIDVQATLFGKGVPLFNDDLATEISLVDVRRLGDNNLLLHYKVEKP